MPNIFTLHRSAYYYASNPEIMKFIGEKHPKARFIEEIALKNKSGGYTPNPGLVFYEKKPQDGHPHYFAYYKYPRLRRSRLRAAAQAQLGHRWSSRF